MESLAHAGTTWLVAHVSSVLRIALILAGAFACVRIARHLVVRVERIVEDDDPTTVSEAGKRARTLGRIVRQAVGVLVWAVSIMLVLAELGLDLKPILAGAGIVGLAIGFGAQTLVKDVISGFFILFENQFRVNDVVSTAGVAGVVEAINLRSTVLRDVEGRVHVVPNGSIDVVTNFTRGWSRALLDVGVAYRADTDRCFEILREVGDGLQNDAVFGRKLDGPFEYPGVEAFGDSAVVLRIMVRTKPQERWNVQRELRRRVKKAFDAHGIEIPFPHLTLYLGEGSEGRLRVAVDDVRHLLQEAPAGEAAP